MCDILKIIKDETAEWHSRVEMLVPVFRDGYTRADYTRLLEQFYGFYSGYEMALGRTDGLETLLPDWRERLKLPWLEEDLCWLGRTKTELSRLPVCSRLPALDSPELALGALYVTEGSTLGGQVISRRLEQSLALLPGKGASFFAGHGSATGSMWRGFSNALRRFATAENERCILASAGETFKSLWLWLS
jgi:heme oxygenase